MAIADVKGASRNLIRTSVPNLISGVSQQADAFKLTTQASEQINGLSSVVDGLVKRPPTELIKEINYDIAGGSSTTSNPSGLTIYQKLTPIKYFKISTTELEDYFGIVFNNSINNDKSIKIFDTAGNEKNIIYSGLSQAGINAYLSGLNTEELGRKVKILPIADYTFLLNSAKTTALTADLSSRATAGIGGTEVFQGMVVVKTGYTGNKRQDPSGTISWSIKIVGTNNTVYATASGDSDAWNTDNDPNTTSPTGGVPKVIASDISTKLNAGIQNGFGTYGRIAVSGSNVIIQNSVIDFKIVVDDGYAGTIFYSVKDAVQNFTDLPLIAPHTFIAKITGIPDTEGDEYYVEHNSNYTGEFLVGSISSSPVGIHAVNEGTWSETGGPGIQYKLDSATMPHAIVKLDSNNFLFTPLNGATATYTLGGGSSGTKSFTAPSWGSRDAGDLDSNPNPSFVGKPINNVFFFKNRLGFLAGESVILSQAGEFFNFFKSTVSQVLDSDPIDITSSTTEIGILYHAVPFYDRLVLFADGLQFSLQSDGELTSKSVSLQQTTSFDMDVNVEPQVIGNKIYFSVNKNNFSSVQEYFINPNTILLDGIDITANVPTYLKGKITQFAGSDISSILFALGDTDKHEVGIYKFFYSGDEKIQSAWSKWSFGLKNNVKLCYAKQNKIYFIIESESYSSLVPYDTELRIVSIDLNVNKKDNVANSSFQVLLDYKTSNFTYTSSISNNDGNFSVITLNNFTIPIPASIKTSVETPYDSYNLRYSNSTGFVSTPSSIYTSSYSREYDLKINEFNIGSGFTSTFTPNTSGTGYSSYALTGAGGLKNLIGLSISNNQFITFSANIGKYKSLYLQGLSGLYIDKSAGGSVVSALQYSTDNSNFTTLDTEITSNTGVTSLTFNFTPLLINGGAEEKTIYFRIVFYGSSYTGVFSLQRSATALAPFLSGALVPSYNPTFNVGTTGIMLNKTPYQFVDSDGVSYETYYCVQVSGQIAVPNSGSGPLQVHNNKLLVKKVLTASSTGFVGFPYSMIYELSRPVLRASSGKGQSAVADGRLQLKNGIMLYDNSRFFQVLVAPKYRDTYNYTYLYNFVPNYLGVGPTNLDYMHIEDGAFTFPVFCKSDDVKVSVLNDSPYPCALLSLEWEALYSARSKRIG